MYLQTTSKDKLLLCINNIVYTLYFKDSWFAQLYDKFRNERRVSQDDEVILHKRKGIEKEAGSSEPVKKAFKRGALHWTPPFPEGEDEVSLKRHIEFLQNEWSRRNPDKEKIRKRMALTFPSRRRAMNNPRPINDVKSEYPALFDQTEVNTGGINPF